MVETKIITDVTKDWLTSYDVKESLRIDFNDDNYVIKNMVNGARKAIEKFCSISIGTQTLKTLVDLEYFEEIELPYGPIGSVTSVKLKSATGSYVSSTEYEIDGLDFKTFKPYQTGRWEITYTAGYNPIPEDLKLFWLRLVAFYYENRGEQSSIPTDMKNDLKNYRRLYVL